ncbi:MAG: hypothetical protein JW891_00365 [Candidatus Lokiarchaeota archaeon]|nr:hypothetical protein [Candidatus Lokiarchaeota archaeon]
MGESSKVHITASRVVALIGMLMTIGDGINQIIAAIRLNDPIPALWAILIILIALVLFLSIGLLEMRKFKLPYEWWFLLIIGIILVVLWWVGSGIHLVCGVLILIACLVELMTEKETYWPSKIVAFIGAIFAIVESTLGIISQDPFNVFWGVIGIVISIFLLLSLQKKIKANIPYSWHLVLIIGFICFMWIQPMGYLVSGTVILVAFVLVLMAY